jgi:hypothetical protein
MQYLFPHSSSYKQHHTSKEGRVDLDADHQGKLLAPEDLIDACSGA